MATSTSAARSSQVQGVTLMRNRDRYRDRNRIRYRKQAGSRQVQETDDRDKVDDDFDGDPDPDSDISLESSCHRTQSRRKPSCGSGLKPIGVNLRHDRRPRGDL